MKSNIGEGRYGGRFYNGETVIAGAIVLDRHAANGATSHGYVTADVPDCVDIKKSPLSLRE